MLRQNLPQELAKPEHGGVPTKEDTRDRLVRCRF
jgi:hypothetical protein